MNEFLPSRYLEVVHQLALGIEPIDAQRARRLSYPLQVGYDAGQFGLKRPPIERHYSNLFALRYQLGVAERVLPPGVVERVDLRFFDLAEPFYKPQNDRRRIVPRRLSIPILKLADVESQEATDRKEFRRRIRRPVFFPGAAYDFSATSTGLRGRVLRGGKPMRWARVDAVLNGTTVVGRAHGDDRGEFLLLINAQVTSGSVWPDPLNINVRVFGPETAPVPSPAELDPLWDLPVEPLEPDPDLVDLVASGEKLPDQLPLKYTATVNRVITFILGKCLYEKFEIT
jgi:hypothetical protein